MEKYIASLVDQALVKMLLNSLMKDRNNSKCEMKHNIWPMYMIKIIMPISPWGLAQVVKEWGGFVGGSRFKSQWGQKFTYQKKNYASKWLLTQCMVVLH